MNTFKKSKVRRFFLNKTAKANSRPIKSIAHRKYKTQRGGVFPSPPREIPSAPTMSRLEEKQYELLSKKNMKKWETNWRALNVSHLYKNTLKSSPPRKIASAPIFSKLSKLEQLRLDLLERKGQLLRSKTSKKSPTAK
jgi:hypothetical protein